MRLLGYYPHAVSVGTRFSSNRETHSSLTNDDRRSVRLYVRPLLLYYLSVAGVPAHGLINHGIERAVKEAGKECEAVERSVKQ